MFDITLHVLHCRVVVNIALSATTTAPRHRRLFAPLVEPLWHFTAMIMTDGMARHRPLFRDI